VYERLGYSGEHIRYNKHLPSGAISTGVGRRLRRRVAERKEDL
jgi:hypothetical protein